jgi:ABC-2 type transport system permease protein
VIPALAGVGPLYRRRLLTTVRTARAAVGQIATPVLWVLIVAPALDSAFGGFDPEVDYFTYVAVAEVAFLVPFTAMFSGTNVIVDRESGITPSLVVAPIARSTVTVANALGVSTVALVQAVLIVLLAVARGASFATSASGILWAAVAAWLLALCVYGVAETLALRIGRQESYGPLIPAVGVTPWFLSGALFPLALLPPVVEQAAVLSPWTHALAVLRHGLMEGSDAGLADIWHLRSATAMAALSTSVLAVVSWASLALAARTFRRTTTA